MLKITFRHIYLRAQCLGEAVVQEFVEILCMCREYWWLAGPDTFINCEVLTLMSFLPEIPALIQTCRLQYFLHIQFAKVNHRGLSVMRECARTSIL